MKDLTGKVAVITGAGSGIGRASALALARAGVDVLLADIDAAALNEVAAEATNSGRHAEAMACDVSAPDAFTTLRDEVLARFGRVDILMNNVGVLTSGRPEDIPLAEWERVLNINLMSVVRSHHAFIPLLLAQNSGHIVNTASMAGFMPMPMTGCPTPRARPQSSRSARVFITISSPKVSASLASARGRSRRTWPAA